ncbi:MAG: hypothetical protein ACRDE7_11270 [Sphingobacterium sp.]
MTVDEFKNSTLEILESKNWPAHLSSLWYAGQGDWRTAHDLIDHLEDNKSCHVHAYLHRMEGDQWNANYWYNRANQPVFKGSHDQEWIELVKLYID